MKSILIILLAAAMVSLGGCKKETATGPKVTTQLKIRIGANGEITANNKQLTDEEFAAELKKLKDANGGVVYSRENAGAESTPAQSAVIQMLQASEIPLEYSNTP